ncbi:MAG: hypothetical protein JO322_01640 [Candidatus Eremiobacteraeota bacterium]|nr:hypothetical protein [Candidatus Eremiobacteraeota bacterium]
MFDDDDDAKCEYVTEEESRAIFPDGVAELVDCRLCGSALLLAPGVTAICAVHLN